MASKGKDTEILSFSVPAEMAREIEKLASDIGYSNRSELIRDAIRLFIKAKIETEGMKGKVEGVMIALYDHSAEPEISIIRHRNIDIIRGFMHTDFGDKNSESCCDVLMFSGPAKKVKELVFDLESQRKVNEVKLFVA
ncbi:MAG: CopG family ribbon-helix-helix protein [Thermoplasmata archaeon]|nr:CopG family ribbon-helix-helix protein [Thermoplasmata archaeon]